MGVLNYFDDIVVYGSTPKEHWQNLRQVLQSLRKAGLRLNKAKCVLGVTELKFLGHIISVDGIQPDPGKIKAITGTEEQCRTSIVPRKYYISNAVFAKPRNCTSPTKSLDPKRSSLEVDKKRD